MLILWFALFVLFLVVEIITVPLVSIWFALGSLGALICTLAAPELLWLQVLLFILLSGLSLALVRPLACRLSRGKPAATNADRLLSMTGRVTQCIDNRAETGQVYIGGKTWSARSADGGMIPAGAQVQPKEIRGVKLIVYSVPEKTEEKRAE